MKSDGEVTRLAPSPTGALHLGNARTFLINWAMAKREGWRVVLRVEDLELPRMKPGMEEAAIGVIRWLGMAWDEGPYYQGRDLRPYQAVLAELGRRGEIYPCRCTRADIIAAQSAPHGDVGDMVYPGTCRPAERTPVEYDAGLDAAWRVRVDEGPIGFVDRFAGAREYDVKRTVGDFVVAVRSGWPSYQLAVVVDDARQGVTQVVRGDDLLSSAARQLLLYRRLGLTPEPRYTHVPFVVGPDGRRLAKRHGDTRVDHYREAGVPVERVIGLIGSWCGMERRATSAAEFAGRFDLDKLPRGEVTLTEDDDRWLLHG
jgi:glutamyl-tRNA synthetase